MQRPSRIYWKPAKNLLKKHPEVGAIVLRDATTWDRIRARSMICCAFPFTTCTRSCAGFIQVSSRAITAIRGRRRRRCGGSSAWQWTKSSGSPPSGSMGSGYNLERVRARPGSRSRISSGRTRAPPIPGRTTTAPGCPFLPLATYRHDLSIHAARRARAADSAADRLGADERLQRIARAGRRPRARDRARRRHVKFRMAVISAEIDKTDLKRRHGAGAVRKHRAAGALTPETIDRCGPIVAQMGIGALHQSARCRRRSHHRRPRVRRRDFRRAADPQGLR